MGHVSYTALDNTCKQSAVGKMIILKAYRINLCCVLSYHIVDLGFCVLHLFIQD